MIPDHEVATAVHHLRGFTPDLIDVFQKHGLRSLRVVDDLDEAARLLEDRKNVPIEQDGRKVLIAEFGREGGEG